MQERQAGMIFVNLAERSNNEELIHIDGLY